MSFKNDEFYVIGFRHVTIIKKDRLPFLIEDWFIRHAAFRFFSASFFRWYAASRLSSSFFGTAITALASCSKRKYSSDGGLLGFVFFILALHAVGFLLWCGFYSSRQ